MRIAQDSCHAATAAQIPVDRIALEFGRMLPMKEGAQCFQLQALAAIDM